jgi:hypothetical protein
MNDIRKQTFTQYTSLDSRQQIVLLTKLADWLTFMARDTYSSRGGVEDSERLRNFNEALNRILAQLRRLVSDDRRRYPDDVFANILVDQFDILKFDPEIIMNFAGGENNDPERN